MKIGKATSGPITTVIRNSGFHESERHFSIRMVDMGDIGIWQTSESANKGIDGYDTERDESK